MDNSIKAVVKMPSLQVQIDSNAVFDFILDRIKTLQGWSVPKSSAEARKEEIQVEWKLRPFLTVCPDLKRIRMLVSEEAPEENVSPLYLDDFHQQLDKLIHQQKLISERVCIKTYTVEDLDQKIEGMKAYMTKGALQGREKIGEVFSKMEQVYAGFDRINKSIDLYRLPSQGSQEVDEKIWGEIVKDFLKSETQEAKAFGSINVRISTVENYNFLMELFRKMDSSFRIIQTVTGLGTENLFSKDMSPVYLVTNTRFTHARIIEENPTHTLLERFGDPKSMSMAFPDFLNMLKDHIVKLSNIQTKDPYQAIDDFIKEGCEEKKVVRFVVTDSGAEFQLSKPQPGDDPVLVLTQFSDTGSVCRYFDNRLAMEVQRMQKSIEVLNKQFIEKHNSEDTDYLLWMVIANSKSPELRVIPRYVGEPGDYPYLVAQSFKLDEDWEEMPIEFQMNGDYIEAVLYFEDYPLALLNATPCDLWCKIQLRMAEHVEKRYQELSKVRESWFTKE